MSEIPADVMITAVQALQAAWHAATPSLAENCIAHAILAERERCAKRCDNLAAAYEAQEQHGWQQQRSDELRYVAGIIRKGDNECEICQGTGEDQRTRITLHKQRCPRGCPLP
jgi:hypothetical protein